MAVHDIKLPRPPPYLSINPVLEGCESVDSYDVYYDITKYLNESHPLPLPSPPPPPFLAGLLAPSYSVAWRFA